MSALVGLLYVVLCLIAPAIIIEISFRQTTYYKSKKRGYFSSVFFNKGALGEYRIYKHLKNYEKYGARFLFNAYLPTNNHFTDTTEIDVIMIFDRGICVFESKNYSGWIFGNEKQKMWTQCLPQGAGKKALKEKFYNPIWQNNAHIKALKSVISADSIPIFSFIAFSERCTLKDITIYDPKTTVINRNKVLPSIRGISNSQPAVLSQNAIDELYYKLLPFTQVSEEIKEQHINRINKFN